MSESILERQAAGTPPGCVLVAGASGGIGSAFCGAVSSHYPEATLIRMARNPDDLQALPSETLDLPFDIDDERQMEQATARIPPEQQVDWLFIATGWLHDEAYSPEKTYKSLNADHLLRSYRTNAIGPALLVKHLLPRMSATPDTKIGILSARVGSISDNRLGGWHAYRASKAALNMLIRNYALELGRKRHGPVIVGLQPGTTDTALSAPFQRNVPEDQLQSPEYTAGQLLKVMQHLQPQDSGQLFDFLGLPFEP